MKPVIPKQHGAWAMLFLPFALGVESGRPLWYHIPLFIGWILLYLATFPVLMAIKKKELTPYLPSFLLFIIPAMLIVMIPLWQEWRLIFFWDAYGAFFSSQYVLCKEKPRAFFSQ